MNTPTVEAHEKHTFDINLRWGCDLKTGFPYVEFAPGRFVSLLPLTKPQVEQFISSGAAAEKLTPVAIGELHAYVGQIYSKKYDFTELARLANGSTAKVSSIFKRRPLGDLATEEALLATNIPYDTEEAAAVRSQTFPEPGSPLALLLGWLGARYKRDQPDGASLPRVADYTQIRSQFQHPAEVYLRVALDQQRPLQMDRSAAVVLRWLSNAREICQRPGLPFLDQGVWELTGETSDYVVWAGEKEVQSHDVPLAVGRCRFLPPLCQRHDHPRRILASHHPCLGVRPVLTEVNLRAIRSIPLSAVSMKNS